MEKVILEILGKMVGSFDQSQCRQLEVVLHEVLEKYDLVQKSTEIRCLDNSWEQDLSRFIIRKHTDGKSERTLKLYTMQLRRMLMFIDKNVQDITEYDLFSYLTMYKRTRKVSNIYLDNMRLIMSSFFGWLHRKGAD